ncbi:MAG: tRNA-dihydrouridine synthase family protein [Agathobacter sp.]|nr:tRNA-dihydrouridine synthase family protein [Agathobacter sp.]
MQFYLAPMEGMTGYIVRNAFHHNFDYIDKYYTPFIPAAKRMNKKIQRDIDPSNNEGITLIPQVMSNNAMEVIDLSHQLEKFGYTTLNINLGCPSGTVVGKKRGSGLLFYPEELDHFLEELYSNINIPVSIKTRIGFNSEDEWYEIAEIYSKYPIEELTIHPRIQKDFYKNSPRLDAFKHATEVINCPLCYNGDITSVESFSKIHNEFPDINSYMIGRGLFERPGLIHEIMSNSADDIDEKEKRERITNFHNEILSGYLSIMSGEKDAMFRMKEIWLYLRKSFDDSDKYWKKIKKAQTLSDYNTIVNYIFNNLKLTK